MCMGKTWSTCDPKDIFQKLSDVHTKTSQQRQRHSRRHVRGSAWTDMISWSSSIGLTVMQLWLRILLIYLFTYLLTYLVNKRPLVAWCQKCWKIKSAPDPLETCGVLNNALRPSDGLDQWADQLFHASCGPLPPTRSWPSSSTTEPQYL